MSLCFCFLPSMLCSKHKLSKHTHTHTHCQVPSLHFFIYPVKERLNDFVILTDILKCQIISCSCPRLSLSTNLPTALKETDQWANEIILLAGDMATVTFLRLVASSFVLVGIISSALASTATARFYEVNSLPKHRALRPTIDVNAYINAVA